MGKQLYQVYDYQEYLDKQKEAKQKVDPEQFISDLSRELGKSKEETMKIVKKLIDEKLK